MACVHPCANHEASVDATNGHLLSLTVGSCGSRPSRQREGTRKRWRVRTAWLVPTYVDGVPTSDGCAWHLDVAIARCNPLPRLGAANSSVCRRPPPPPCTLHGSLCRGASSPSLASGKLYMRAGWRRVLLWAHETPLDPPAALWAYATTSTPRLPSSPSVPSFSCPWLPLWFLLSSHPPRRPRRVPPSFLFPCLRLDVWPSPRSSTSQRTTAIPSDTVATYAPFHPVSNPSFPPSSPSPSVRFVYLISSEILPVSSWFASPPFVLAAASLPSVGELPTDRAKNTGRVPEILPRTQGET